MLVLSRHVQESILIGSGPDAITITVVAILGDKVRIGIEAPNVVPVHRLEIANDILASGRPIESGAGRRGVDRDPARGTGGRPSGYVGDGRGDRRHGR